jgi:hypothetical protein
MSPTPRGQLQFPRHLLPPGQEGYRTPTIEDGEGHYRYLPHFSSRESFLRPPIRPPPSTPPIPENEKADSHDSAEPKKLPFKLRLRHFTWSYFTLTMATGGIANVLHTGTGTRSVCTPF